MGDYYFCQDSGFTLNDLMEFADLKLNPDSVRYDDALCSLKERKYGNTEKEISLYISKHLLQCQDCHRIYDQQKEGVHAGHYLEREISRLHDQIVEEGPSVDDFLAGIKRKLKAQSLEDNLETEKD